MSDASIASLAPHVRCPHRSATTGSWRSVRPVIDPGQCNLCLLVLGVLPGRGDPAGP